MSKLEISHKLALAIGWPQRHIVDWPHTDNVGLWYPGTPEYPMNWRPFSYEDSDVHAALMLRYQLVGSPLYVAHHVINNQFGHAVLHTDVIAKRNELKMANPYEITLASIRKLRDPAKIQEGIACMNDPLMALKEMQTIRLDFGRQTGKTEYVKSVLSKSSVGYFLNRGQTTSTLDDLISLTFSRDLEFFANGKFIRVGGEKGKKAVIVVDDASVQLLHLGSDFFYKSILDYTTPQTEIILIG
jgi:hypothetical protein